MGKLNRRKWLQAAGGSAAAIAVQRTLGATGLAAQEPSSTNPIPDFTGPGPNPYWNSPGQWVSYAQKAPMILLTDRPVQLETPRRAFLSAFTPNESFFVRWHLPVIPNTVDLKTWRLHVEGNVERPLEMSFAELTTRFKAVSVAGVNQCSGNSRSLFQPRVAGGQWGNGAMGNALWTGVRLREILDAAGVKSGSLQAQFEGLEKGMGPRGYGSNRFMKSLDLNNPVLDECIVAYSMNHEPLPLLNGFPVRLVVPGFFATYWMKGLTSIRILDQPDDNFWMKAAYRIPDTPRNSTTPEEMKSGKVPTIPIARMPVRSFLISPDGSSKIPAGFPLRLQGMAFSGYGGIRRVEVSADAGAGWRDAQLGEDFGAYSFRTWSADWTPARAGKYTVAVRATDAKGNVQPDAGVWNPGGYEWNKIERQEIVVGESN
ncbi:MAG: molybdopterin-dependent oxidoreductase [Acidobacteriia bacterium]|nr:molybdopterin-dependent oxidoreductase [Terriglobia bacterium]